MNTKKAREERRNFDKNRLIKQYQNFKEITSGVYTIWTFEYTHNNILKKVIRAYRGTSAKPFTNFYYQNEARFIEALEKFKKYGIEEENRKKNEVKTPSGVANVAKRIREDLKRLYPGIKFRVTSKNYTGGDSVRVEYLDFLPDKELEKRFNIYQRGHFNGYEDIYENGPDRHEIDQNGNIKTIPTTKFLFIERKISENVRNEARQYILKRYSQAENKPDYEISTAIHRITVNMNLTNGFNLAEAEAYNYGVFDR